MTLTTHAITGAAIAQFFPNHALVVFVAAFASHFLLDAIPHWDYTLYSVSEPEEIERKLETNIDLKSKALYYDLFRIGSDFAIGILISLILFSVFTTSPWITIIGALGGMLPDPLQFVYWKFKYEPIISLQKFHMWVHADRKLKSMPLIGIPFQIVLLIVIISCTYIVKNTFI